MYIRCTEVSYFYYVTCFESSMDNEKICCVIQHVHKKVIAKMDFTENKIAHNNFI